MTDLYDAFSGSYREARGKFLAACAAAGLAVDRHPHPSPGRDGEALALDVARDGPEEAEAVLLVTSGCHGVEGFCGSGVQVALLADAPWRAAARAAGVAVLYLHALNPYGFSHIRRATRENVDLNRNFHDFSRPLPANPRYAELHDLLLPAVWPPTADNEAAIEAWVGANGLAALQQAVSQGQHTHPDGLFYGGTEPTWSNRTVRSVLRRHGRRARRLAWVDLHTGLGPSGVGERIFADANDPVAYARTQRWWGGSGHPVTSIYDASSSSAFLTGMMWLSAHEECPQAEYTGLALEYGTLPFLQVHEALRAEHWLHVHPEAPAELAAAIRQRMREAFYTDTDAWREAIVAQACEVVQQAVAGLSGRA